MWITGKSHIEQSSTPDIYEVDSNELYYDSITKEIYLAPTGLRTDNYTMPLGMSKTKYDVRPSHIHDIGCRYHKVILVKLNINELIKKDYLYLDKEDILCRDIPIQYLELKDIDGRFINDLFYRMMLDANIPKSIAIRNRVGVSFNLGWFFTKNNKLTLEEIYKREI